MPESKSSSRIFLVSSLALGVLAMAAAFVYLENSSGQERGPKAKILVARRDLKEGTALDPAKDLDELDVPASLGDLRSRALDPALQASYKGQRVNRTILAGSPVWLADLAADNTLELRGDARALSIQVKGANAMGGLVAPGDYVKLLVTRPVMATPRTPTTRQSDPDAMPLPTMGAQQWETVLIAPTAYRVLAVNQRLSRSRITAADLYQSAGDANAQQTVALEVTEAQARQILETTGAGQMPVTLLLCPPQ